jgi:hypothetical protein
MENNKIALRQKQLMQLPVNQKLFVEKGKLDKSGQVLTEGFFPVK